MDERILKWLHDIYMAIERNLKIIGEATNRIYKEDSLINIEQ